MEVTSIRKTEGAAPGGSSLNAEVFMKLFTTQLSNQNPMEPMDGADFLNQFSQITSIQTLSQLQQTIKELKENFGSLSQMTQAQQAQSLLGREIVYSDASGQTRNAVVEGVRLENGLPQLVVSGGALVQMDSVRQVLLGAK